MGYRLVSLGWLLVFVGVVLFFADALGWHSRLWWPTRPEKNDRAVRIFVRSVPIVGVVVIVVGAAMS